MKNPSRADAPEGFADLSIFFPDTILRAEHLHAYADRADWRCAHTSARRTTAVGGVRADMSLSTYDVTISCDTHSISPRENQSARVYRGPCRARHRFQARSRTLPLRKHHEPAAHAAAVRHGPAHCRRKREGATQFPTIGLFERNANNFKGTRNTKAQKSWSSRAEPEVRIHLPPGGSPLRT
jgi:hypothetical protein